MSTQSTTIRDQNRQRKIRTNAILLGLVAFGFFLAFIVVTALKT